MSKYKLAFVIGTRPDIIRCSSLLKKMTECEDLDVYFIHTGQHYDKNLNDVFFQELNLRSPDVYLTCGGGSYASQHARLIEQLESVLLAYGPDVCMFWGDTNAVIGCITPFKMGIPIIHGESGMRSYNMQMPEEKNRIIIDRVSDALYVYHEDHRCRLVQEGICPSKIVNVGNTIVEVLNENLAQIVDGGIRARKRLGLKNTKYAVMTLHRNENMIKGKVFHALESVAVWAKTRNLPVILPVMPRLKELLDGDLAKHKDWWSRTFIFCEPLSFFEFAGLERTALIEFTDSGTNQETSALQRVPCVVIRSCTERPETFESGITYMDDMNIMGAADAALAGKYNESFSLGDGKASKHILDDMLLRLKRGFERSEPSYINKFVRRNCGK